MNHQAFLAAHVVREDRSLFICPAIFSLEDHFDYDEVFKTQVLTRTECVKPGDFVCPGLMDVRYCFKNNVSVRGVIVSVERNATRLNPDSLTKQITKIWVLWNATPSNVDDYLGHDIR